MIIAETGVINHLTKIVDGAFLIFRFKELTYEQTEYNVDKQYHKHVDEDCPKSLKLLQIKSFTSASYLDYCVAVADR
jgi:hypothetical protein